MSQPVFSDTFESEVLKADRPVLVDFWATWCAPCRALAPVIDKLAQEFEGQAKVVKVDVDKAPDLASEYDIRSIPTVLVFHGGKEAHRWIGGQPLPTYSQALRKLVGSGAAG